MPSLRQRRLVLVVVSAIAVCQCGCSRSEKGKPRHRRRRVATVVLDPGHGGRDTGAWRQGGEPEKELVLDISIQVERLLKEKGIRVVMTRRGDEYVRLWKRVEIANDHRSDLFVSIHANSCDRETASGFEIYYGQNGSESESLKAATLIQQDFGKATEAKDRGIRRYGYLVLTQTKCPSVLIEVGYLSNQREARLLSEASYRQKVAKGIATGIVAYLTSRG